MELPPAEFDIKRGLAGKHMNGKPPLWELTLQRWLLSPIIDLYQFFVDKDSMFVGQILENPKLWNSLHMFSRFLWNFHVFSPFCIILSYTPQNAHGFPMIFHGFPKFSKVFPCFSPIVRWFSRGARRNRLVGLQEEGGATQGAADHAQGASAWRNATCKKWRVNG